MENSYSKVTFRGITWVVYDIWVLESAVDPSSISKMLALRRTARAYSLDKNTKHLVNIWHNHKYCRLIINSYLFVRANVRKRVSCTFIHRHTHVFIDKYYCVILHFVCLLSVCLFNCVCFLSTIIWWIKMNIWL